MATAGPYTTNQLVRLKTTFKDINNALVDPGAVTIKVRKPDGTTTSYTGGQLTHDSTGVWHVDVTVDQGGDWYWRAEGTAPAVASGEQLMSVEKPQVT